MTAAYTNSQMSMTESMTPWQENISSFSTQRSWASLVFWIACLFCQFKAEKIFLLKKNTTQETLNVSSDSKL